jgi:hypothetical protein
VVTGLVVLRAGFLAARMASLLMGVGLLTGRIGLLRYAGAMGGLALRVLPLLANAIRIVGLALTANPIGLAITAIAAAAALVIANWEPVKAFFEGIWDKVGPYFSAAWEGFKKILSWTPLGLIVKYWGPISTFFGNMFGGLGKIIGSVFDWISNKIKTVTETVGKVAGWLSDTFGIGDSDGEPIGEKLARNVVEPAKAAAAAVVVGGTAATAAPPGMPDEFRGMAGAAGMTVNITVNAAPGQDAEEIAKEVKRILDRETGAIDHE